MALLSVENLDLYYGDAQALSEVSLEVGKGEIVAIVGANGAGKSSLIRCIAGIEVPRSGTINFKDSIISGLESHQICNLGIGQVAEGRQVFPTLSVLENLQMGAMLPRARASARRNLDDVFSLFPVLDSMLRRRGGDLSGGQQQQLAIGRALVMRPRLLLLDEPTEGIQPSIIKDIGRAITYLRGLGGIAIVLVEQYLDFARELGDHFAVMERGSIVYASDKAGMDEGALKRALAI